MGLFWTISSPETAKIPCYRDAFAPDCHHSHLQLNNFNDLIGAVLSFLAAFLSWNGTIGVGYAPSLFLSVDMARRKGEISNSKIDRDWPFRVALLARLMVGPAYITVRMVAEKLSLAPAGYSFMRVDEYWTVWCFAERDDANAFRARFGGEVIGAGYRPKWPG